MRAEAFALRDLRGCAAYRSAAAEVFACGDIDHFLGDDAGFGEFILGDRAIADAAQGLVLGWEFAGEIFASRAAIVFGADIAAIIFFDIVAVFCAPLQHPVTPVAGEALLKVDGDRGV